jgi:hypothetical protein
MGDSLTKLSAFEDKKGHLHLTNNLYLNILMYLLSHLTSLCRALPLQYLWSHLDDMSFLTINTLLSLKVPPIAHSMHSLLLQFVFMDLFQTELWLP